MVLVWSIYVEMYLVFSLAWDVFCRDMLRLIFVFAGMIWSTYVEIHFESSLAWYGFCQQKLRCIWCPRWHAMYFVDPCWETFWVLAGTGRVFSTHDELHFVPSLAWERLGQHKFRYNLRPRCMIGDWSTHVELHLVSLAWDGFCQHMLRYTLRSRWHGRWLVNTRWDTFSFSLAWDRFSQHNLIFILCPRWHGRGLVN